MRTLGIWERRLMAVPSTIDCAEMQLLSATDHAPPVLVGPGRINIRSLTSMDFTMFGSPTDGSEAFRRLVQAEKNPYEVQDQFRLVATDFEGTEWSCGWTRVELVHAAKERWLLTGQLESIMTIASGHWTSNDKGVELLFTPKLHLLMKDSMVSVTTIGEEEIQSSREASRHTMRVLGSEITFYHLPESEALYVTASASEQLYSPYLENWLSEPLRILIGQPVYPRLVARNLGEGKAQVSLRPSPSRLKYVGLASLLGMDPAAADTKFWDTYAALLTLIANARDANGHPSFERHRLTRYYEEISQSTQGSRWVLCLTLASSAEGIAKMLMRPDERRSDFSDEDICGLRRAVAAWDGNPELRGRNRRGCFKSRPADRWTVPKGLGWARGNSEGAGIGVVRG